VRSRSDIAAAAAAALLILAGPAAADDAPRPPQEREPLERQLERHVDRLGEAADGLIGEGLRLWRSIPRFGWPEVTPEGDIVIPRRQPEPEEPDAPLRI